MNPLSKRAALAPYTSRLLGGAALGGIAGSLGGAALDREDRGRGALLGGLGGVVLGAGAGHLSNRAVANAVKESTNAARARINALTDQMDSLSQYAKRIKHTSNLYAEDYGLDPITDRIEDYKSFLRKLNAKAYAEGRDNAYELLFRRHSSLGDALNANNAQEIQEHYGRLGELLSSLKAPTT